MEYLVTLSFKISSSVLATTHVKIKAVTGPLFQVSNASLSGNDCCYMIVFQYGSIVLFNVPDHEVDRCLKIVEKHASGLLPEMRKDGELSKSISIMKLFFFFIKF